jgi:hypothetical protein
MGEYWKPVNFTKREYVHPPRLDCGLKLGEWHYPESAVMCRVTGLLASGQWQATDDICACSDYGGLLQMFGSKGERPEFDGYEAAEHGFKDASLAPGQELVDTSSEEAP